MEVIRDTIKKYYWFKKTSSTGHLDLISGEVVHPMWEGPNSDGTVPRNLVQKSDITENRIEGIVKVPVN